MTRTRDLAAGTFELATVIKRDDVQISRAFSRHVLAPDADTSSESAEVQAIANAAITAADSFTG